MNKVFWGITFLVFPFLLQAQEPVIGVGQVVSKSFDLETITQINMAVRGTVYLSQGKEQRVVVEAQKNVLDAMGDLTNEKGSLDLTFKENRHSSDNKYKRVVVYVTVQEIDALLAAGGGASIIGQTEFEALENLTISIAGGGNIEIRGDVEDVEINIAGGGEILSSDLTAAHVEANIVGGGLAEVQATNSLEVNIVGGGQVRYAGKPKNVVKKSILGGGVQPLFN